MSTENFMKVDFRMLSAAEKILEKKQQQKNNQNKNSN